MPVGEKKRVPATWHYHERGSTQYDVDDIRFEVHTHYELRSVVWHSKGDFFATLADEVQASTQVLVHSFSKA